MTLASTSSIRSTLLKPRFLATTLLVALMAPQGVQAMCRCYCGNNYWTNYNQCSAASCQSVYGTCPYGGGWSAQNQNPSIIGGSVGGFIALLFFLTLCLFCMRRRRRRRGLFLSGGPGPVFGMGSGGVYTGPPPVMTQQQQPPHQPNGHYPTPTPYDAQHRNQNQGQSQAPLLFPEPGHSAADLHDRRHSNASTNGGQPQYPQYPPPAGPPPPTTTVGGRPSGEDLSAPPPAYRA